MRMDSGAATKELDGYVSMMKDLYVEYMVIEFIREVYSKGLSQFSWPLS